MKEGLKVITWLTFIGLLVGIGLHYLSGIVERKDSYCKFEPFYQQEENFDVLFIGSSHVLNGIYPMELWNEYGIVSYNFAGHGNRLATSYWVMKNALDYTQPKLIVIDCAMVSLNDKTAPMEQVHLSFDHFPLSENKVAAMEDLFPEGNTKWDFLWKFSTYHNRWNTLTSEDYLPTLNIEKGAEARTGVAIPAKTKYFEPTYKTKRNTLGVEYLEKIIQECKNENIEILLTYLPFPDPTGWQAESNRVKDIAKKHDIHFLDYHTLHKVVNDRTDFYDADSHMNQSGARKITSYIGQYIMDNYAIKDQRKNPKYASWHDDYALYSDFKLDNLKAEDELNNYLMLLNDKNLSYALYLPTNPAIILNSTKVQLLKNLGIDTDKILLAENNLIVVDNKKEKITYARMNETVKTDYGRLRLKDEGNINANLLINGEAQFDSSVQADIAIAVFDNTTKTLVHTAKFESNTKLTE